MVATGSLERPHVLPAAKALPRLGHLHHVVLVAHVVFLFGAETNISLSTIQSAIKIYRDILRSYSWSPEERRRRDVRSGHDGLHGWEADDGTLW